MINNSYLQLIEDFNGIVRQYPRIGLLVSGGIDSGIALYLLLKCITEQGATTELHTCTVTKTPDAVENAARVIGLVSQKFDITVTHHVVDSIYDNHIMHTVTGHDYLTKGNIVDVAILATNAIVPHQVLPDRPNPRRGELRDPQVIRPFIDYTKDVTVGLALKYELYDLLEISHSCIKVPNGRCNTCYWCLERAWGFELNEAIDPGQN